MKSVDRGPHDRPRVSVVMANFQAGAKIVPALRSVLAQSMADLEVIVSDDASRDNSVALVREMMAADPRIRLVAGAANRGPAHCRNQALDIARGEWVAVVDSDDIIHPERFERLLAAAAVHGADIVADDLLLFHEDGSPPSLMLGEAANASFTVSPKDWVLAGMDGSPALGYLKPMIRADRLKQLRYDQSLRIGEDYDFVLRLLMAEANMLVVPEPFYLYRRHSASISHRLSVQDMQAMLDRQDALAAENSPLSPELSAAFAKRRSMLKTGLAYEKLVASIKARQPAEALSILARDPSHLGRLWTSFAEGRTRRGEQQVALKRPETITLGGQGTPDVEHVVPDYVPAHLVDWSAPGSRLVWRDLAAHANGRCIAVDDAGRYAAGFIPEAILVRPELLRRAS